VSHEPYPTRKMVRETRTMAPKARALALETGNQVPENGKRLDIYGRITTTASGNPPPD